MDLDDLYALLLSHKMRIEQKKCKFNSNVVHNLAVNFAQKNQGSSKNDFGNQNGFNRDM